MNNNQCTCLEKIGDNGPCLMHGAGYASGMASLFAAAARKARVIEFVCQVEGYVGRHFVVKGERLTAVELKTGLWAISGSQLGDEEFAHLNGRDFNRLAGCLLVEEAS